jgi:hypothetical protein
METLESRRMMDGTLPSAGDGDLPPVDVSLVGALGRGRSAVIVSIDDPNEVDDPNERMLTPNGKSHALPAASLKGILNAMEDPNQ